MTDWALLSQSFSYTEQDEKQNNHYSDKWQGDANS